jgi:hypothetical protein
VLVEEAECLSYVEGPRSIGLTTRMQERIPTSCTALSIISTATPRQASISSCLWGGNEVSKWHMLESTKWNKRYGRLTSLCARCQLWRP